MTCILEWKCYCEAYFKNEVAIFFGKVVVIISHALEKKKKQLWNQHSSFICEKKLNSLVQFK